MTLILAIHGARFPSPRLRRPDRAGPQGPRPDWRLDHAHRAARRPLA